MKKLGTDCDRFLSVPPKQKELTLIQHPGIINYEDSSLSLTKILVAHQRQSNSQLSVRNDALYEMLKA
ncbi:MAG: hypothetical protein RMZ43_018610 [Nostoc sp. CmiVER01]|uniref:hypothetical protein n=1 Tax=Nostoc sp. CmiVER01 TaxID=3075384 RepID=UPI002AD204F3|nr:hypothetical protein [Nostoc sp. CmiVER01]MDZ8126816.1 hypothetical protein [Nostoc sp. CmiVER01]